MDEADCREPFVKNHAYDLHRECSGRQYCGPMQVPRNMMLSCNNRLSSYAYVTYECVSGGYLYQSIDSPIDAWIDGWVDQSVNQSRSQPIYRSINQLRSHPADESIDQAIDRSITRSKQTKADKNRYIRTLMML